MRVNASYASLSVGFKPINALVRNCRLLQAAISSFSLVFPDYQERIARHEAAHFLSTALINLFICMLKVIALDMCDISSSSQILWVCVWPLTICVILVAYLLGLPILGYSLDIGKEHVNLIDERLEKLIYSGQLDAKELDRCLLGSFI